MISSDNSGTGLYFLIGFMGSGKSMLSQGVQRILGGISVEMDEEIEKVAGMSINDIFSTQGEDHFRKIERQVLHDLIDQFREVDDLVLISTGGGAPCFFDNMEVMKNAGTTIFINPSIDRLVMRLENRNEERPLIRGKSRYEIKQYIGLQLEKRLPFYRQAHLHVNPLYEDKELNIKFLKEVIQASGFQPLEDL